MKILSKMFIAALGLIVLLLGAIAFLPDTEEKLGFDIRVDLPPLPLPDLPETFSGPLLANRHLSNADHLFVNELSGPECFAEHDGRRYTGLADSRIVEILPDRLRTVTTLDDQNLGVERCASLSNFGRCGRPLGMKFGAITGTLYVADPHNGIWSIDVRAGKRRLLVTADRLDGAKFLDDLVVLERPSGHVKFYVTDASSRWTLIDVPPMMAEGDRTGRLLSYDTESDEVRTELSGLAFPNGIELTDDRKAVLFAVLSVRQIWRYDIAGPDAGKVKILTDNLPGEPDNIKRSRDRTRETYWLALYSGRNRHNPHLALDRLAKYKYLKRFAARLVHMLSAIAKRIGMLAAHFDAHQTSECLLDFAVGLRLGHGQAVTKCNYGMAVEIDGASGEIVSSLHSPDGTTCALSDVFEVDADAENDGGSSSRHFLLGSAWNPYIGRVSVPIRRETIGKSTEKVTEKIEKSSTTTPPPQKQQQQQQQPSPQQRQQQLKLEKQRENIRRKSEL